MSDDSATIFVSIAIPSICLCIVTHTLYRKKKIGLIFIPSILPLIPVVIGSYLVNYGYKSTYGISEYSIGLVILFYTAPVFIVSFIYALILFLLIFPRNQNGWYKKLEKND